MGDVGVIAVGERLNDRVGDPVSRLPTWKSPRVVSEARVEAPPQFAEPVDLRRGEDAQKRELHERPSGLAAYRAVRHAPTLNVFVAVENGGDPVLARTLQSSHVHQGRRHLGRIRGRSVVRGAYARAQSADTARAEPMIFAPRVVICRAWLECDLPKSPENYGQR